MKRTLASLVVALGTLQSSWVSALGLGDIQVESALNEPLSAAVKLLNVGDLNANQVLVGLASGSEFDRAGVDRPFFLSRLNFAVQLDGRGGGTLRITSREPVREPYLDFLLEARWPNGRLVREYTVLLDLPTFSEVAPAPVTAAARVSQPAPKPQLTEGVSPRQAANRETSRSAAVSGREYQVQDADTLWGISRAIRPEGATIQQTMLSIQAANPGAFIAGNINRLKRGAVLRLPSDEQILSGSSVEAAATVREQNRQWRASGDVQAVQVDATPQAARQAQASGSTEGRLSIAASGETRLKQVGEGAVSQTDADSVSAELNQALTEVGSLRDRNQQLTDQVAQLQQQLQELQRALQVENAGLAALQARQQGPMTESVSSDAASDTSVVEREGSATESAGDENRDAPAAALKPTPKPVVAAPLAGEAEDDGLMALLAEYGVYLAAGGGALLLLGLLLLRRRSAESAASVAPAAVAAVAGGAGGLAAASTSDSVLDDDFADLDEMLEAPLDAQDEVLDEPSLAADFDSYQLPDSTDVGGGVAAVAAPETTDPIAEAEIYLAYGRTDQAEALLRGALAKDPNNSDIHLKMLELALQQDSKEGVLESYQALRSLGDGGALGEADALLSAHDEAVAWLSELPPESAVLATPEEALSDFSMSLPADAEDDHFSALDDEFTLELEDAEDTLFSEPAAMEASDEAWLGNLELGELDDFSVTLDDAEPQDAADAELALDDDDLASDTSDADDFGWIDEPLTEEEEAAEEDLLALDASFSLDDRVDVEPAPVADMPAGEALPADDAFSAPVGSDSAWDVALDIGSLDEDVAVEAPDAGSVVDDAVVAATELTTPVESDADALALDLHDEVDDTLESLFSHDDAMHLMTEGRDTGGSDDLSLEALDDELSSLDTDAGSSLDTSDDDALDFGAALESPEIRDRRAEVGEQVAEVSDAAEAESVLEDWTLEPVDALDDALPPLGEPVSLGDDLDLASDFAAEDLDRELDELGAVGEGDLLDNWEATALEPLSTQAIAGERLASDDAARDDELALDLPAFDEVSAVDSVASSDDLDLEFDIGGELPEMEEGSDTLPEWEDLSLFDTGASTAAFASESGALPQDEDEALEFLGGSDEVATKLDLARAYIDMGDHEGASEILNEVVAEGSAEQQREAQDLLQRLS